MLAVTVPGDPGGTLIFTRMVLQGNSCEFGHYGYAHNFVRSLRIYSRAVHNVVVHPKQPAVIANGHRFSQPLTKTVSRTVMIHEANGHVRRVVQKVRFVRTATVDGSGHEVYGDWRAVGQSQFNKLYLPNRRGLSGNDS